MKKISLLLVPIALGLLFWWHSSRTDPLRSPPALSKSAFDCSIGIDCLGSEFILHRPFDQAIRKKAHILIDQRKSEWAAKPCSSIPRIIHQVWTSEEPLPDQFAAASRLLKQQHPDFTYIFWTPNKYGPILQELVGPEYSSLPLPVQRDLVVAAVLWQQGGLAADLEAECVQPITPLLSLGDCLLSFDPPRAKPKHGRRLLLSPAVIASAPSHPMIKVYLTEMLRRVKQQDPGEKFKIEWITQDSLTTVAEQFPDTGRVLFLGPTYFCPVNRDHIRHFRKILEGEEKRSMIKKVLHSLHLVSIAPYSDIARETIFVHMEGGREKIRSFADKDTILSVNATSIKTKR